MADINVGKQIVQITSEEIAKEMVSLYNNFINNRSKISSKITRFINRTKTRDVLQIHSTNYEYSVVNPDTKYFKDGYRLINDIRKMLGLEEVDYMIGVYDSINNKAYQINIKDKEFDKLIVKRGTEKAGLEHSMDSIQKFLKNQEENKEDITDKFLPFIKILEDKTNKNNDNLNYGYAFEAYGHFVFKDGHFRSNRHNTYYNYYKASRKNTEAWTTGGDINHTQYKLIRIYKDKQGVTQISSASVTSSKTILNELTNLKKILDKKNNLSPEDIALNLAKHFTQYGIDKKLDQGIMEAIDKAFEKINLTS